MKKINLKTITRVLTPPELKKVVGGGSGCWLFCYSYQTEHYLIHADFVKCVYDAPGLCYQGQFTCNCDNS